MPDPSDYLLSFELHDAAPEEEADITEKLEAGALGAPAVELVSGTWHCASPLPPNKVAIAVRTLLGESDRRFFVLLSVARGRVYARLDIAASELFFRTWKGQPIIKV